MNRAEYTQRHYPKRKITEIRSGHQFGRAMRQNLTSGSVAFRKAYVQSIVDLIEVDDDLIRIKGSKDVLERAVLASPSSAIQRSQICTEMARQPE